MGSAILQRHFLRWRCIAVVVKAVPEQLKVALALALEMWVDAKPGGPRHLMLETPTLRSARVHVRQTATTPTGETHLGHSYVRRGLAGTRRRRHRHMKGTRVLPSPWPIFRGPSPSRRQSPPDPPANHRERMQPLSSIEAILSIHL